MAYDELYDGDVVRSLYQRYFLEFSCRTASARKHAQRIAEASFSGDAHLLPLVRLMTNVEYRTLVKGVRQRGRALRMFLMDHYFGDRSYERAGILTKSQVTKILQRYEDLPTQFTLRRENIHFWYAPDIIRDETGNFRVIEDNIGFVGGIGDLEALAKSADALGVPIPTARHPRTFYQGMVASYKREACRCGGGKTILLSYPQSERPNHEDQRLERIMEALQVTPVTNLRTLRVRSDGLFHRGDRVGFVIMNIKLQEIEPQEPSAQRISGFWRAVSQGQLGISYAPGLEFVGDKRFYSSVEALVEHYLSESCLLRSLATLKLENLRSLERVRKERERWVIKLCRGQGGESVWVGKHLTARSWTALIRRVEKRPGDFIAQEYCAPSQFLDRDVDLRPLAIISPRGERVSPLPWGRAANGKKHKTNISLGGLLAPVAVV